MGSVTIILRERQRSNVSDIASITVQSKIYQIITEIPVRLFKSLTRSWWIPCQGPMWHYNFYKRMHKQNVSVLRNACLINKLSMDCINSIIIMQCLLKCSRINSILLNKNFPVHVTFTLSPRTVFYDIWLRISPNVDDASVIYAIQQFSIEEHQLRRRFQPSFVYRGIHQ